MKEPENYNHTLIIIQKMVARSTCELCSGSFILIFTYQVVKRYLLVSITGKKNKIDIYAHKQMHERMHGCCKQTQFGALIVL